jgi:hypothetical protein
VSPLEERNRSATVPLAGLAVNTMNRITRLIVQATVSFYPMDGGLRDDAGYSDRFAVTSPDSGSCHDSSNAIRFSNRSIRDRKAWRLRVTRAPALHRNPRAVSRDSRSIAPDHMVPKW